jgi:hypothetical protein
LFAAALALLCPVLRSEQPQKAVRPAQEDRIKKLEDRADAAEKAATAAAIDKDYITRTQKFYESYYEKILNTQMWTMAIVGLILTGVFLLVARFSLRMIDERTKLATAEATVQMRNEYGRAIAKEVQKLWDSNAADIKKLKESLAAQAAELAQDLKARSEFQMQFVQALAQGVDERQGDSLSAFRDALKTYKSAKSRNLIEASLGATTVRSIFESLRKSHGENLEQAAREELADPLYNGLEEELALAALLSPWLTPLINERIPPAPEPPPASEPGAAQAPRQAPLHREILHAQSDLPLDEESDSCRLITT